MKNTYTCGKPFSCEIELYFCNKYEATAEALENAKTVRYDGVKCWDIITGAEAAQLEKDGGMGADDMDMLHEYLVLRFEDGDTATFRNSCVDMFRVR